MHIPKILFLIAATAFALNASSTFAKDTDEAAKLREAMRQKMAEANGAKPAPAQTAPATPAKPVTPAKPAAPAAAPAPAKAAPTQPVAKPAAVSQPAPAAQASKSVAMQLGDTPEDAALREAMRTRMENQPQATTTAAPAPEATATKPAQSTTSKSAKAPVKTAAFEPLQAPPSPLSGTKEEQLQQLLQQYKSDQITPEEYHTQRAKIVAQ